MTRQHSAGVAKHFLYHTGFAGQANRSMMETGRRLTAMDRCHLLLQPWQLPLYVRKQHLCHVQAEPVPHHHTQDREILPVLGESVRGHYPAVFAQGPRHVEDGVVLDLVRELERERRQLVSPGEKLERAELLDPLREVGGNLAGVALDALVTRYPK